MGVPALFRWLSKKYPKIIRQVVEEEEAKVPGADGNDIEIPIDISGPNPNGEEFDSLYLDMNGIVHPCTHPEGKPAPETEEQMMVEIFSYTERVVNMIRPRKLLFMAIDGVAPRAKMNQQRSRRFRASQEAQEKEEARLEAEAMWKAMGKTLSDEGTSKKAWDSNAITPGTPFMDLLASSLRYWVARKLNTDPGWKDLQVIISDASVPGEGEHKIMDFIRRQRSHPAHDPNTRHVIYGLDADLIMLSLATHEPHFRVLREDVFAQSGSQSACRACGQEGHYAAACEATPEQIAALKKETPVQKKPFIFLDVAVLREYLEAELKVPQTPFPFNLEQAIDDWVLLIFFVGNDFLPHLPSLEIREGAIDTLLRIWRRELPRMGGYLTNNGHLELARAQIILEGLAQREDDIFKRRRESEERQDQNAKRRKIEKDMAANGSGPSASLGLSLAPSAPLSVVATRTTASGGKSAGNDFAAKADSMGLGGPKTNQTEAFAPQAVQALAGSNRDVVANRRAIRMANMSAAEVLKAELAGLVPVKPSASSLTSNAMPPAPTSQPINGNVQPQVEASTATEDEDSDFPGLGGSGPNLSQDIVDVSENADVDMSDSAQGASPRGSKRKHDVEEAEDAEIDAEETLPLEEEDGDATAATNYALKVNADGTVQQEDTVRLWEPGYRERYYKQKFGVPYSDIETRKNITTKYIEGMAWVLHYYYQGTPSWQWYYPYHFAPFAADFEDVDNLDLQFELGQPFKPFEQLMGVFPAASRSHIPTVFHDLMTDKDSPIIDFYPTTFQIDMNGKRMAWQGVALLPFIDQTRLLDAMTPRYPGLADVEVQRNKWGNDVLFVGEENSLYGSLEALYGKRKSQDPAPINPKLSKGIHGSLLPNPDCIPGSTYICPLTTVDLPDIKSDRSLSALFFFPKQLTPHRAVLLPGVQRPRPTLTEADRDRASRNHQERGPRNQYGQRPPPPGMYQGQNGRPYNDRGRDDGPRGGPGGPPNGGYNGGGYNNGPNNGYGGYGGNNHNNRDSGGYSNAQPGGYGGYGQNQQSHGSYGGYQGQNQPYQQPGYQQSGYRGRGGPPQGGGYNSYNRGGGRGGRGGYDGGSYGGHQSYGNPHDNSYGAPSYNNHQQGGYGGGQGGYGRGGPGGGRGGYDNSYGGYGGGGQSYNNNQGGYGQGNYGNNRGGYNNSGRGRGRQW